VSGKLNVITTGNTGSGFDFKDRYNIISGTIGGFFLALSYFGTDQSQVGRYITAKNDRESKLGLLLNGVVKIPMQFLILLLGVLLFTFYQFKESPIFFNRTVETKAWSTPYKDSLASIQDQFKVAQAKQLELNRALVQTKQLDTALENKIQKGAASLTAIQKNYKQVIATAVPGADVNDTNYIFLRFVVDYLPVGLIGLLIAVIFLAAWGSIAAALNSLASCTVIDFHLRFRSKSIDGTTLAQSATDYKTSKWYTLAWGVFCILTAQFATGMGSLIEAVNVLGSLFYGVILGIFLVAFYAKKVGGTAVFWAAIVGEIFVIVCFLLDKYNIVGIGFLWLNVIGAVFVFLLSILFSKIRTHAI
jgi:Na+/proline symporter